MKTRSILLFLFLLISVMLNGWCNTFTNDEIQLRSYLLKEKNELKFDIKTSITNQISVIGPLESGGFNVPQTYWLEAQDINDNKLKPKLPTGYGLRPFVEPEPPWISQVKQSPIQSSTNHISVGKIRAKVSGGSSGPLPHYKRVAWIKEPGIWYGITIDVKHLKKWFDFELGKTYSIKLLLQPNKEGPIYESNPILVTIPTVEPKSK